MEFLISGVVREAESKRPLKGLMVKALDRDLFFDDVLGNSVTDSEGKFAIGYEERDFREIFEKKPDIYLRIYGSKTVKDPGRMPDNPIYTTRGAVRFNAGRREHFVIEITADELGEDRPGGGVVSTPEPGRWKGLIDEFIKENPISYSHDPDKVFAAPRLKCTSNFGPEIRHLRVREAGWVTVRVTNIGPGTSFFSYVQVYEGPVGYTHQLRDHRLNDYRMLTINPGQTVDVKLYWTRLRERGRIVGVCFDPFLDPRGFSVVEQYNPHITSIHYLNM